MAKELPYFKFEPGQWENGSIQMATLEQQGAFINICSIYWQRLGDLPYKLALQKACAGNATALDSLIEDDIIKLVDGLICIDFLNEQLDEFENTSKTNSENARLGWEKRRKEANAMRPHSERNAIREEKRRREEIREEEIKEDKKKEVVFPFNSIEFNSMWEHWKTYKKQDHKFSYKSLVSEQAALNELSKLSNGNESAALEIINQSIAKGWKGFFEIKNETTNGKGKNGFVQTAAAWARANDPNWENR